ncbi:MAG: hypothetical protein A2Z50_07625 [Nitrospirae bacterium RBG_19FT_COMBO_42_15]|nr:MAG: hypothetical protein A2Z50_07625 [Nitrospirae bacterium RBG_19FT_COMBO_42_15]
MKVIKITTILALIIGIFLPDAKAFTNLTDCLITSDIGIYNYKSQRANMGKGSGVVGLAGHFGKDHDDTVCTGDYSNINQIRGLPVEEVRQKLVSVKIQLTQHSGSDSDKWLLHEVERGFRRGDYEENMTVARFRNIDGNNIFYSGLGGGTYRWISNYVIVSIEYIDLYKQKPEPIEVVRAYLAKFPSTIPALTIDKAHDEKWLKDEMERRLWLCDKWFYQLQLGKAEQKAVLQNTVDSMQVFLNYREKYYGIAAKDDKNLLSNYLMQNNGTGIKNKLKEYKGWWSVNKDKPINL